VSSRAYHLGFPACTYVPHREGICMDRISMTEQLSGVCRYPAGALTSVRIGAKIGLLDSVSQDASLRDFLLAPTCPVEKGLWEGFLYSTSGSETDKGVAKDKVFARTGNRTTRLSLHPLTSLIECHDTNLIREKHKALPKPVLSHGSQFLTQACYSLWSPKAKIPLGVSRKLMYRNAWRMQNRAFTTLFSTELSANPSFSSI